MGATNLPYTEISSPEIKEGDKIIVKGLFGLQDNDNVEIKKWGDKIMSLAGISIRRPVATTMVMVSFIFIGLLAMFSMKKELIPNIKIPVVTITTTWTGAVSEDVETQVTKKIKDSLSNVEAIDKIQTVSAYGVSNVVVNFDYGVDTDEKVTQIQREVSKIANNLPNDANTPLVRKVEAAGGNMTAIIAFNADSKTALTTFIKEQLKPRLESYQV